MQRWRVEGSVCGAATDPDPSVLSLLLSTPVCHQITRTECVFGQKAVVAASS